MSVKTKKSLLKTLVIVTLVVLCGGVNIANAGNLGTGSYYLFTSHISAATAQLYGEYGLYYLSNGYDASPYLYYAYENMYDAATYAQNAYEYCYDGYISLGTTNAYYAYVYAYYDYAYTYNAYAYLYACYLGYDYTTYAIDYALTAQIYNGYAAYFAGLASYGGYY
jgi:hypothetical protein